MTTAYTSLLGLALPVTGELSGTWGDTVNNSITSLLDTSVAGTTNVSTDTDVTLTTTTGAANTARQAILLFSGARTALRTVTAPAQSKVYTVINATTGGFSVKLVGAGPTTGVTIVAGESAVCAWNGSDFIKISNTGGSASFTNVTVTGTTTLSGLTASTALALDASKNVVSVTNTGTGNNVLSASPTLTGTIGAASLTLSTDLTLSGGTANGVAYLNGSKVVTSGSALTFDGTKLGVGTTSPSEKLGVAGNVFISGTTPYIAFDTTQSGSTPAFIQYASSSLVFGTGSSERMRLTSGGNLGLGITSPYNNGAGETALEVRGANYPVISASTSTISAYLGIGATTGYVGTRTNHNFSISTNDTPRAIFDTSGNLGLGVTDPATYGGVFVARATSGANFSVRTLAGIGGSGTGVGLDALNNGASSVADLGIRANTIQFRNSGSEAARIDSSGNMGIGTTSISSKLYVAGGTNDQLLRVGNTNAVGTQYISIYANGAEAYYNSVNTQNSVYGSHVWNAQNNGGTVERARIDSSGNFIVGTGSENGAFTVRNSATSKSTGAFIATSTSGQNYVIDAVSYATAANTPSLMRGYSGSASPSQVFNLNGAGNINQFGGQITFPATQDASANANTLDDYEEGTWSVLFQASGSNPTVTYSLREANYTKVGRLVNITIALEATYVGGSGTAQFTLPFPVANLSGQNYPVGLVSQYGGGGYTPSIASATVACRGSANLSHLTFRVDNNTASADEDIGTFNTGGFFFRCTLTYMTT